MSLDSVAHVPTVERRTMSDYGVPDDSAGVLPWTWAQQRLADDKNDWVVAASAPARPHVMPVWRVGSQKPAGSGSRAPVKSRKARNVAANPQCVVTVDHADANYLAKTGNDPAVHPESCWAHAWGVSSVFSRALRWARSTSLAHRSSALR